MAALQTEVPIEVVPTSVSDTTVSPSSAVDSNAGIKGVTGALFDNVSNAYKGALAANLMGATVNVDDASLEGPGPDQPDFSSLTRITQAYNDGLITRAEAQIRTAQLVKQSGVDNPGYATFFRQQASEFFAGLGGGGNPFGDLTQAEKDDAKLNYQQERIFQDMFKEFGLDYTYIKSLGPEVLDTFKGKLSLRVQEARLARDAKEIGEYEDYAAKRQAKEQAVKFAQDILTGVNLVVTKANTTTEAGRQAAAQQLEALKLQYMKVVDTTLTAGDERKALLNQIASVDEIIKLFNGDRQLEAITRSNELRKQMDEARVAQGLGMSLDVWTRVYSSDHLRNAIEAAALPGGLTDQNLNTIRTYTDMLSKVTSIATNGGTMTGMANGETTFYGLDILKGLQRTLGTAREAGDEQAVNTTTAEMNVLVGHLAGKGLVYDQPTQKSIAMWDKGLVSLSELNKPEFAELRDILKTHYPKGLKDRIVKEYMTPLAEAANILMGSLGNQPSSLQVTGELGSWKDFVEMKYDDGLVTLAVKPIASTKLTQEELTKLTSMTTQFNSKIGTRITRAAKLETDLMDQAYSGPSVFQNYAEMVAGAMGLPGYVDDLGIEGDDTETSRAILSKLDNIDAMRRTLDIGDETSNSFLQNFRAATMKTKVVDVQRDEDGKKLKQTTYNLSELDRANIAAKRRADGEEEGHPIGQISNPVAAIRYAQKADPDLFKGIDENYLYRVAQLESNFNPSAKSPWSSATGLFQFIDSTWNNLESRYGKRFGISGDLRKDPVAATLMVGALTSENRAALEGVVDGPVTKGQMYMAHVIGPAYTKKILQSNDELPVSALLPASWIKNNPRYFNGTVADTKRYFEELFS